MAKKSDLKTKIDGLNRAFQFYYKANNNTLRKASDFYLPFIFGRKKRMAEFNAQYIPLSVAMFLEGVRNTTAKMEGTPDVELIETLKEKLLPKVYKEDFDKYWNVIESELEINPEEPKAISVALTNLFMFQIFGPGSSDPNPYNQSSDRHQVAIEFQLGKILYQYSRSSRVVLERIKDSNYNAAVIPTAAETAAAEAEKPKDAPENAEEKSVK